MKIKSYAHEISSPAHMERGLKLCYNKTKLVEVTYETSPHGYSPCLLVQFGGDHVFYTSASLGGVLLSFCLLPYAI